MVLHRHLSRTASHRRSLLKNLASDLLEKESITTTWAKAKEAQSFTERIISYTKMENQEKARSLAQGKLFRQGTTLPKLFEELGPRYKTRNGGYTRVLKLEPRFGDKAPQAIVELVDGEREIKFWLCARIVARLERQGLEIDETTQRNVDKLVRFRENGEQEFRELVEKAKELFYSTEESIALRPVNDIKLNTTRKNIVMMQRPVKSDPTVKSE
ncbi:mitochondrial 54S ribosomal protein YmL8 [Saccharomycopsis crataegensis]|uniref:Mitochondrial 54S ribosomal protein YmL8 n=1 Tax=Saccharomycopsis crataegensis TaxID=43959 RepID=A0AAV5QP87_9ASCO|nr:mitochondrial 54S ribosomal protein YmL8 [Saccharomycopsis crataegensis]